MSDISHDTEAVVASGNGLSANRDRAELAAAFREGSTDYFDENVAGESVQGLTNKVLGAAIAIVRGEEAADAYAYVGRADSKEDLVDELEVALEEAGFEDVDISGHSVGPVLPTLVGILTQTHDVEI